MAVRLNENKEIVKNIFYFNKNYIPTPSNRKSGTKIAFAYAQKKKKQIINLYNTIIIS